MTSSQTTNLTPEFQSSGATPLPEPEPEATESPAAAVKPLRVKTPAGTIPSLTSQSAALASDYDDDPVALGSTPSSDPAPAAAAPVKLNKTALVELARGAVLTASLYVHSVLARTDAEKAQSVWVADDDDQAQIGDPLAAIAQRRGASAGMVTTDTAALIEAGIGVLAYGVKNVKKLLAARRLTKQAAASSGATLHGTETPA